ncbi:MAG: 3-phosphoshikimate 1-carboxyvinyltransferase [Myxococcaceae bacterium]
MNVTLTIPARLQPATLTAPVSKSDAQRALVLSHILGIPSGLPKHDELPRDVRVLAAGLSALSRIPTEIDCADGGAPFRFLLTQAAVTPGARVLFHGTERLAQRPHRALIHSLRRTLGSLGAELAEDVRWPYAVAGARGKASSPMFHLDASESSQFASSLLLGCASLCIRERREWSVQLEGPLASAGYLDLTVHWLRRAGFSVVENGPRLSVRPPTALTPPFTIPSDASSAAYLLLLAWRSGSTIENPAEANHPDAAIRNLLAGVGLSVHHGAAVTGAATSGLSCSIAAFPDLAPTLAALSLILPSRSTFTDCTILRGKESDRLAGLMALVAAFGADAQLHGQCVTITPRVGATNAVSFDSAGDHRLAMSAATAAILTGRTLRLTGAEAVEKSFPGYWTQVARCGVNVLFTE